MSQPDADLIRDALEQQDAVNAEPEKSYPSTYARRVSLP